MAASHIAPEDFSGLASALQDAWNAQYHLESLRRTIRNHESLLVNPVEPVRTFLQRLRRWRADGRFVTGTFRGRPQGNPGQEDTSQGRS